MSEGDKSFSDHVEIMEQKAHEDARGGIKSKVAAVMGTVKLTEGEVVYVPAPTADPRDPMNLPYWRKLIIIVVISIFSTLGLALVSGFGGLLGFYIPNYTAVGYGTQDITNLMTFPTLFMGIGNLIGIPFAIAVGRRIVLLVSTIVLIVGAIACASAQSYSWHFAARNVVGLAAGQSEALVPMITQELFFLHERSKSLMIQQAVQVCLTSVWILFASPIAGAITPDWWYGLGAILAGIQFILAFIFLPETKYERPLSDFQESTEDSGSVDQIEAGSDSKEANVQVCTQRPPLDIVNYSPRTWRSDMRLWVGSPEWRKLFLSLKNTFELLLFPNVLWAMLLNGLTIGVNIAIGTTYSQIVSGEPYNWPDSSASYVNCGQIVVAIVALPLLGDGSDFLIKKMAQRNDGIHEPETRIISLIFPIAVGVFTAVLYGMGAEHPHDYHWFVYVWAVAAYYFCFVGANIVAITYLLDSYPKRSGPLLIIICAFRGIISFGTSYGTAPFIELHGYDGAFGVFAGLTGALGLLGVPIYFWGKNIRQFTGRFAKDTA